MNGPFRDPGVWPSCMGLVAAIALALALPAHAWGPMTHAYIAMQVIPDAPPAALFGAMAADMNDFSGLGDKCGSAFKHLTHREAKLLAPSPLRQGLLTHDADWGADSYAHAYFHLPTDKTYPLHVYEQLSSEKGITMNNAEDIIESLMDYVICRDLGSAFAKKVLDAVDAAGPVEEQAFVDAYTAQLMERMPELTREQAEATIRKMFQADKVALRATACFMMLPDAAQRSLAPSMLSMGTGVSSDKIGGCVDRGIELCADWRPSLDKIAQEIAGKMRELKYLP